MTGSSSDGYLHENNHKVKPPQTSSLSARNPGELRVGTHTYIYTYVTGGETAAV